MIDVRFRDKMDIIHFFGSSALTIAFFLFFLIFLHEDMFFSAVSGFFLSLFCGVAFETLTQFTPHYDHPFWNRLPKFLQKWFSGSPWDHRDIELNVLGALVFYPILIFIGHLFMKRFVGFLNKKNQPLGMKCVVCGRRKDDLDPKRWFSITQGKHIFYACPSDFPRNANETIKQKNLQRVIQAIQSKLSQRPGT